MPKRTSILARAQNRARPSDSGTAMTQVPSPHASPTCLAQGLASACVDPQQAIDVARWRKYERSRLLAERAALSIIARQDAAQSIASHLDQLLAQHFPSLDGIIISAWWPLRLAVPPAHSR